MKTSIIYTPIPTQVLFKDMKVGQIGLVRTSRYDPNLIGKLVLRTYTSVVSLDDPINVWLINLETNSTLVELLPKGTIVQLEVE